LWAFRVAISKWLNFPAPPHIWKAHCLPALSH
jgi:hypothetical protein